MGKDIAVIENGDRLGTVHASHIQAHSMMIAAEFNSSCFSMTPLTDIREILVPAYFGLHKYLDICYLYPVGVSCHSHFSESPRAF